MASRVYQIGTIVSRVNRLLETRVLKNRPLWLDVVETFPPDSFPKYNQTAAEGGRAPLIVYPEDELKHKFYDNYTIVKEPKQPLSLFEEKPTTSVSVCSRFVAEQQKALSLGADEAEAGRTALRALRCEGVDIRLKQSEEKVDSGQSDSSEDDSSPLKTLKGLLEQMHSRKNAL